MTEPTSMLPGADRPRALTTDERDRLRQRLGFDSVPSPADDARVVEPTPLRPPDRRPARRALAAAAGFLLLALALTVWRAQPTTETAADRPPSACVVSIPPLAAALDVWGGLDPWLLSDGGEPDVGSRLADLLDALADAALADEEPDESALRDMADEVRAALEPSATDASMAERLEADDVRDQVLRDALELAIETVAALPDPACDAGLLRGG